MKGTSVILFSAFALALGNQIGLNESGCPTDFTIYKTLPHEAYCNLFYVCSGGELIEKRCAKGLVFNSARAVCDWPTKVDCRGKDISEKKPEVEEPVPNPGGNHDPSEAPAICAKTGSDGLLVAHENCDKFYKCDGGKPVSFNCFHGLFYNSGEGICDWPEKVVCGDRVVPTKAQLKRNALSEK